MAFDGAMAMGRAMAIDGAMAMDVAMVDSDGLPMPENHFDGSRNAIVLLGGERRYILAHPNQCENLAILPKGHPSARHSEVDWSDPDYEKFPKFKEAKGNEVVLQAGDAMYLPTNWFHYIISMSMNFQCNTRSGIEPTYMPPIRACGFPTPM